MPNHDIKPEDEHSSSGKTRSWKNKSLQSRPKSTEEAQAALARLSLKKAVAAASPSIVFSPKEKGGGKLDTIKENDHENDRENPHT